MTSSIPSSTPVRRFVATCVERVRNGEQLHTRIVPEQELPQRPDDTCRFEGYLHRGAWVGRHGYVALVSLVVAWLAWAIADRSSTSAEVDAWLSWVSVGATGLGLLSIAALVAAGLIGRTRIEVVIDVREQPLDAARLRSFAGWRTGRASQWLFARGGVLPDAVLAADEVGIRILGLDGPRDARPPEPRPVRPRRRAAA
ncbi:MAG: hypothetical protein AB1Z98_12650 [Nannocystaceae bacterium]